MNKGRNICIIVPHKGIGDIIFHNSFIKSISQYHNKKVILFSNYSTKANLIYKNNKYIKNNFYIDLKRPFKLFYIFKIIKIIIQLSKYNIESLYYTGNSKWHKISFKILSLLKNFELKNIKVRKKFIISHLKDFLRYFSIKYLISNENYFNKNEIINYKKKFKIYKEPCVFLSIDTSEDQIKIPNTLLLKIVNKLKKKYNYIFINTNKNNSHKTKFLKDKKIIQTSKYNILEIFF